MRKTVLLIGLVIFISRLFISCNKLPFNNQFSEVVYIQTNNYLKSQNAIIAYRNFGNGKLTPILGGPFFTGGSGVGNPQQIAGPNESDNEIIISNDKQFLLAVNSGSNTIAVFKINLDGTLSSVPGSPFDSYGQTPVSLSMRQQFVYVANKAQNPLSTVKDNAGFTVFRMQGDGSLQHIDTSSSFLVGLGASASSILVDRNSNLVFTTQFLEAQVNPAKVVFYSNIADNTGRLIPHTSSYTVPGDVALGLWENPTSNVLYVSYPLAGKIGVWGINAPSTDLTAKNPVNSGPATTNIRTNNTGDHMYALNAGDNSVSVFNTSNASVPVLLQKLALKNAGPAYNNAFYQSSFTTSECFSLGLSSNEKNLFVVSQHTNPDFSIGNYNYLHVLTVHSNGTLSEEEDPMQLPVPNNVRPRGVAVYRIN